MNKLELWFDITPAIKISANQSYHYHNKGQRAKKLRNMAYEKTKEITSKFTSFTVDIDIFPPSKRRFDPPNLYPTVKHLIDGMTDSGLWDDDDYLHLIAMTFRHGGSTSGNPKNYKIKITIKECPQSELN